MRIAQQLYEGIELGAEGATGLITYMRTDSTRISAEAEGRVKGWINEKHGSKYVGAARVAKASPGAQDAHEAIRPTDVALAPDEVKEHLTADQARLYALIWQRFVASQMAPAVRATLMKIYQDTTQCSDDEMQRWAEDVERRGRYVADVFT